MTDANKATLTSMLVGQEGMAAWLSVLMASEEDWQKLADKIDAAHGKAEEMANTKMGTLEGDVKTLSSAFEALQLEIFEGGGGEDLRAFTQGLTDDIRFIQNAIKDGLDIGDIGGLLAKVAMQLKDKFLAFDGVGSILAGGALVMGLKKIYDLTMRLKEAAIATRMWWQGTATTMNGGANPNVRGGISTVPTTTGGIAHSVGTMNVSAGVVNVNGKVSGGGANNRGGTVIGGGTSATGTRAGTTGGIAGGNTRTNVPPSTSAVGRFAGVGSAAAGAGLFTALFAVMDTYATRSTNESRINEAKANYNSAKELYDEVQNRYNVIAEDPERAHELPAVRQELSNASQKLNQTSSDLKAIQKEAIQHNNESLFGGAGAITGAAAGAAIGSIIPGAGTAAGAVAGAILGMIGAAVGAEIGKEGSKFFDFDVLGWLKGENDNKSSVERAVAQADWETDSGKKYSELSSVEKIEYQRNETETERIRREESQNAARNEAEYAEFKEKFTNGEIGDAALAKVTKEDIDAGTAEYYRQQALKEEAKYKDYTHAATFQPTSTATSMYDTEDAKKVMAATSGKKYESPEEQRKNISERIQASEAANFSERMSGNDNYAPAQLNLGNQLQYNSPSVTGNLSDFPKFKFSDFFSKFDSGKKDYSSFVQPNMGQSTSAYQTTPIMGDIPKLSDFTKSLQTAGDFLDGVIFNKAAANSLHPETNTELSTPTQSAVKVKGILDFEMPDISKIWSDFSVSDLLPDFNLSEWFSEKIANFEMPDLSSLTENLPDFLTQPLDDFNISDLLPDFNLSEWFSEKTADFEMPDISTLLPDISTLGESFAENFSAIPETISTVASSISEGFSQIPVAATSAFSEIATAANEGWATIQSEWSQVLGFFEGLWAGAAGAASSAGSAIASGLTGVIGGIIGAWQSAAATISSIISSIASVAANAASALPSLGGVGANATGTSSWQGGFTEINEQGGEIIDLPRGTRIYPHATTMKLIQRDIEEGKLDEFNIGHNATGTASWRGGFTEINEQGGEIIDLPSGSRIYPQATTMKMLQRSTADNSYFSNSAENFLAAFNPISSLPMLPQSDFSTFPQALQLNDLTSGIINNSSTTSTNRNDNGVTVTGNTFNIRKDSDINEIAFKLFELMFDSQANYVGS